MTGEGNRRRADVIHCRATVRAPHELVAETLWWNPGKALGLALLLGAGDEVVDPEVDEDGGAIVAQRERTVLDPAPCRDLRGAGQAKHRHPHLDPGRHRAHIGHRGPSDQSGFVRLVIGLAPETAYRTTVGWRGQVEGRLTPGLAVAVRLLAPSQRFQRRIASSPEAVADAVEHAVDPAVDLLRQRRASPTGGAR
jgi:hypothetical protein